MGSSASTEDAGDFGPDGFEASEYQPSQEGVGRHRHVSQMGCESSFSLQSTSSVPRFSDPAAEATEQQRQDFARLWEQYVPGGSHTPTVSRPLMREVLLRAVRELALSPRSKAWAEELVANALEKVQGVLSVQEAFAIYLPVMRNFYVGGATLPCTELPLPRDYPKVSGYVSLPKGARLQDPAPTGRPSGPQAQTAGPRHPSELFAPMQSTRAAQESTVAALRASLLGWQSAHERLRNRAATLKEAIATNRFDCLAQGPDQLVYVASEAAKIQDELDKLVVKQRSAVDFIQQNKVEITWLREAVEFQGSRHRAEAQRRLENQEKLEELDQRVEDLTRQAKTEQLRSIMLREAFEQEQNRVGLSLGQAEAFVHDQAMETEVTRRVEAEEMQVSRQHVTTLNQIHAAKDREELAAEAKIAQLRRELEAVKLGGSEARPNLLSNGNNFAGNEDDRQAALVQLTEVRRRNQASAAQVRRSATDVQMFQRQIRELQQREAAVNQDLAQQKVPGKRSTSKASNVSARIHLEEAAESALRVVEARLQSELADAQVCSPSREGHQQFSNRETQLLAHAQNAVDELTEELGRARGELTAAAAPGPRSGDAAPGDDLVAAGLQRRTGMILAAKGETDFYLKEELLRQQFVKEELDRMRDELTRPASAAPVRTVPAMPERAPQPRDPIIPPAPPEEVSSDLRVRLASLRSQLSEALPEEEHRPRTSESLRKQLEALRAQLERD